jgi:hypothetical protein
VEKGLGACRDACCGRGDTFLAVTGGEKVHHGNLVEGVWLESESSPFGELLAESAWKILESFGKVAIVGPAET